MLAVVVALGAQAHPAWAAPVAAAMALKALPAAQMQPQALRTQAAVVVVALALATPLQTELTVGLVLS